MIQTTKGQSRAELELVFNPRPAKNLPASSFPRGKLLSHAEFALDVLHQQGLSPKVFCLADPENESPEFVVASSKWNWFVRPVQVDDLPSIPTPFSDALLLLLESGLPVNEIAIATPIPRPTVGSVVAEEGLRTVSALARGMLFGTLAIAVLAATPVKDPDPVLLVEIDGLLVEIGRWNEPEF